MDSEYIRVGLLSRSLGPSCSNVELLFLGQKRRVYRAYGVPGGAILIQRFPVSKKDLLKHAVTTVIVIDGFQSPTTNKIDDISIVAYNQAETSLLAAASAEDLSIYSLTPFQATLTSTPSAVAQTPGFVRLLSVPFAGIVAAKWTLDGEGLLVSDKRCQVTCLTVADSGAVTHEMTLSGKALKKQNSGSIEVQWVHKFEQPQLTIAPGEKLTSIFAALSSPNDLRFISPTDSEDSVQEIAISVPLIQLYWNPRRPVHAAAMRGCLLTVDREGVIRIWTAKAAGKNCHLGCSQLQSSSTSQPQDDVIYHTELVIDAPDTDIIAGSMQACWVDLSWNSDNDPRLAWILSTYLTDRDGQRQEWCAVHVVHGLPVELNGILVCCSRTVSFLSGKVLMDRAIVSSYAICGVLIRSDPTPRLLIGESHKDSRESGTRTALLTVDMTASAHPLTVKLESMAVHKITGFETAVRHLMMHPEYDCVCVLTDDLVLGIWDLWPIRKLRTIEAEHLSIGKGIYTMTWIPLQHEFGELGHILVLGNTGLAICRISIEHSESNPSVSVHSLANLIYQCPLYPLSIISLCISEERTDSEVKYLMRSRSVDPAIDDTAKADVYHGLSIHQKHDDGIKIAQQAANWCNNGRQITEFTVLTKVHHEVGGIVVGTPEGTLEFFRHSKADGMSLKHCSSCSLSATDSYPSVISCLSTCAHAPYIACVTSFDPHQNEDKLFILQSESMCGSLDYRLEDSFISPSGDIAQICWVQKPSPFLSLVVGYVAGQVDVFVRNRQGLWVPVGKYMSCLQMTTLATTHYGLPVVGAGRHLLFLSNDAHSISNDTLDAESVMQAALSAGGALPDYHHIPLLALLQLGHFRSISAALNAMVEFLKEWERIPKETHLEAVHAPTITGPASLLKDAFHERIVPELIGFSIGKDIIRCVPFSRDKALEEETATTEPLQAKAQPQAGSSSETTGLLTGQFDMSQFNNNFNDNHKSKSAIEATGLLDMSAFGMGFDMAAPEINTQDKPPVKEAQSQMYPNRSEDIKQASSLEPTGEEEDCVLFSTDPTFDERHCKELEQASHVSLSFDEIYADLVLKNFSSSESHGDLSLPLADLLGLTKSNASMLRDLIKRYSTWTSNRQSQRLDIPGMKFLVAAKLIPLSAKSRPKKAESKNNLADFRREDYVSPFLKMESKQSQLSEASLASGETDSSVIDERLTKGYISWPESVGILSGIEAIHLLWAAESEDPFQLLESCLAVTASATDSRVSYAWERLKELGCGFWLRDKQTAKRVAEDVAKEQFKKSNDPQDCALMYIALGKKNLLGRLFRSNGFVRVADLLSKDFSQELHQQSAAKNAFVLLGQHRYSLAAAFFLVGGHVKDAIGVCAKEMHDPQLALFLATILDDVDAEMASNIIDKEVFPDAVAADDRVAQGLLYWIMGKRMEALKAITTVKALKSELAIVDRTVSKILLLQFVLWRGLAQLSGRFVPLWMFQQIKNVAAHSAHVLEFCGMPLLALKALQCSQQLEQQFPNPTESSLYETWSTRIVTSIMTRHLPSSQALNARDPAMILWYGRVQDDLSVLSNFGLTVNSDIVFRNLQYIMDCLYNIPSSQIFAKQASQQPVLGQSHLKSRQTLSVEKPVEAVSVDSGVEKQRVSNILDTQPCDLLHVDGDRCVGVCVSKDEGFYGLKSSMPKRIAVATGKHGIHFIDWDTIERPTPFTTYWTLYGELEKRRWPSLNWLRESAVVDSEKRGISMREASGGPLKYHPCSTFFLSGCAEESVLMWQYGESMPCARFVLQTRHGGGFEPVHRISWSTTGDRIAAIGNGGLCGLWDIATAQHHSAACSPDWIHRVSPRKGHDVEFVDGSGSVIATTGEDDLGRGVFSIWDTLAPQSSSRIAHLEYRHSVTELATVPGTLIFLTAQESGSIHAYDFRMLGREQPRILWSLNSIHDGPIMSIEVGWMRSPSAECSWELAVATGGRDGDICIANDVAIEGRLRQRLSKAHWKKTGQLAHLLMTSFRGNLGNISVAPFSTQRLPPDSATGAPVMDLDWCAEGLISAGADGIVQLFPFGS